MLAGDMGIKVGTLPTVLPHVHDLWQLVQAVKPQDELIALCLHTVGIDEIAVIVPGLDRGADEASIRHFLLQFTDEVSTTEPAWIKPPDPIPADVEWLTLRLTEL